MDAGFYRSNESMVQLHILSWPSLDNLNAGAKLARITDAGARFDAMRLDRSQFDLDFPKDKPVESQ